MKIIEVEVKVVERGFLKIEVSDNATEEDVENAVYEAEANGQVFWNDRSIEFTNITK